MADQLTPAEQRAAAVTAAKIEALRADSRRRLSEQGRNPQAMKRRRSNILRSLEGKLGSA